MNNFLLSFVSVLGLLFFLFGAYFTLDCANSVSVDHKLTVELEMYRSP